MKPNKPDAVNPAMALWLTIEDQWRRVTDLERLAGADMKLLRVTGAMWLCIGIVGIVHGISSFDFDLWMPALLVSLFFGLAGFLGYSLLRGRLWVLWPLRIQVSLLFLAALIHLCTRLGESDWSVWSALFLSAWTVAVTVFATQRRGQPAAAGNSRRTGQLTGL